MENFEKVVLIGRSIPDRKAPVFCKIKFDGNLSISGVVGPKRNGDCVGGCGQIGMSMEVSYIEPAEGWDADMIAEFLKVWRKYHLNHMQAGSPAQTRHLESLKAEGDEFHKAGFDSHYDWALSVLKEAGLQPDKGLKLPQDERNKNGYHYGTKWLRTEVHPEAVAFLKGLSDSPVEPAWV